ncbi:hypothetical protein E2562_019038 [Oryza meyeriana var. granulata]|uniref:Uncharacterized protein n=1 Tax=Oryza meyeriana var. granulata TaxID=110450 RepID=A0A6G1EMV9_9ORYZ|nr:hypothetical protein E2562_019038 [Oryza meyeriana var. granulata]
MATTNKGRTCRAAWCSPAAEKGAVGDVVVPKHDERPEHGVPCTAEQSSQLSMRVATVVRPSTATTSCST